MFTKDDFLHYFNQLQNIEAQMHQNYQHLFNVIEHPEYKKMFGQLAKEETDHIVLVKKLKKLFAR